VTDRERLLAAFDEQVRTALGGRQPEGVEVARDGPLLRATGMHRGFVTYRDLGGLRGADLDALIARTCDFFAARGEEFEWKTYGHDEPADLTERLRAHGFVPDPAETVVIGETARMARDPLLPDGVALREVTERADLERIAAMESAVWGEDWSWLADDLVARLVADPGSATIVAAEAGDTVVSAAWLVYNPGTEFAGLWGGSTLAGWRGRGLYRALVAHRALRAAARGVRYLQVDASDESRPILERLGFVAVTTTTPYIRKP
jgi:hypothetical protein